MPNLSAPSYLNASITTLVSPNPTPLTGLFISNSTGSQTIAIFDSGNSLVFSPVLVSAFTPASIGFYPMPFNAKNGLNVSVSVAGSITYTVAFG